jgi:hypothetical protein
VSEDDSRQTDKDSTVEEEVEKSVRRRKVLGSEEGGCRSENFPSDSNLSETGKGEEEEVVSSEW